MSDVPDWWAIQVTDMERGRIDLRSILVQDLVGNIDLQRLSG